MVSYYEISVVVGTYNPVWKKLKATLKSVLEQKNIKLQIVVTDDGSKNTLFTEIENFFVKEKFEDYKLIANEKNEGTVCNFYRGIIGADAEYVKGISPGDLFYDKNTLSKWLHFTKENNADITFCDAVFYNMKDKHINIIRHAHNPQNVSIYLKPSTYHDKVINYIILGDKISGAAIIVRKDLLQHYLKLLLYRVIYTEDFFIRLAVLDKRKILYYQQSGIWYEYADGGISTTGENVWKQRIQSDNIEMDRICEENWDKKDSIVKKWLEEYCIFNKQPLSSRWEGLKRYGRHYKWLYFWLYGYLFRMYSPVKVDDSFLKYCFENN